MIRLSAEERERLQKLADQWELTLAGAFRRLLHEATSKQEGR